MASTVDLERTSSHASNASTRSRDKQLRAKPRRYNSSSSIRTPSDKSLTSFPSLSPIESPTDHHHHRGVMHTTPSPGPRNHAKTIASVEGLTATTPSMRLRNALFDDTPQTSPNNIPGSLHHASNEHIERLVARHGAVTLVRQMAEDVAQRDAQIVALRRRFEERERILRKMLSDCEVSNLDIEVKLRKAGEVTSQKPLVRAARSKEPDARIDQMMIEAMNEDMSSTGLGISGRPPDSGTDEEPGKSTARGGGWKDYFWNNTRKSSGASSTISNERSRPNSISGPKRKVLQEDLFQPPVSDNESRKSSSSIASWALKLVAGTNDDKNQHRRHSTAPGNPPSAAKAALIRVSSQADMRQPRKKRTSNTTVGPNGTLKASSKIVDRPKSPASVKEATASGPVEMDTIFSEDVRPPPLSQGLQQYQPTGVLTDRFGFIYDQTRNNRKHSTIKAEMLRTSVGNKLYAGGGFDGENDTAANKKKTKDTQTPTSPDPNNEKWQDYLKTPTFPTELLSHTPSAGTLPTITTLAAAMSRRSSQIGDEDGLVLPPTSLNPSPIASPAVSDTATLTPSTPKEQVESVKILVEQLTDLHDNLQEGKTAKWNEFLRKVRAERRREDKDQPTDISSMPETALADGEMIGVAGLGNKGKVGRAKWAEFRSLVLGGIPVIYRGKIWAECCGAAALKVPGYYDELVRDSASQDSESEVAGQIAMDINRTLTDNVFFRHGPGVSFLKDVLLAYARRNPSVGYCQGMNLIAASLLIVLPSAEDAFWVLCAIVENLLPTHYFDASLLASRADQLVLRQYVRELLPQLDKHLEQLGVALEAMTFQWFLSLFTDCLSAEALYRVWDVVLCSPAGDGGSFLFHVALALLKLNEPQLLKCDTPAKAYGYINHEITNHAISIDGLVQASEALKKVVRRADVEERRKEAVEAELQAVRDRERRAEERASLKSGRSSGRNAELEVREPVPIEDVGSSSSAT